MIEIKLALATATLIIAAFAWIKNKDIFSPVKIYLSYTVFFYLGIYTDEVRWETLVCYAALLISVGICLIFEPRYTASRKNIYFPNHFRLRMTIWLLSVPGVLIKIYLIYDAGGISEYASSLVFRVRDWAGLGHLTIWFNMLPALSLVYFCSIIVDVKKSWKSIFGYGIHFVVFLMIGMLTGSRSYVAITFLGMIMMYSYLVRSVRLIWIAVAIVFLIIVVGLIGAARNNFGNDDLLGSITSSEQFETMQIRYGIMPLEIVFEGSENPLLGGTTYLSLLTNFIPRTIYPDKFETGGIAFTRIYTRDQYGGLSNLATGAIAEGILNFGFSFGIFIGLFLNLIFLVTGCILYRTFFSENRKIPATIFHLVIYFYIILGAARFSFAEFTDIIFSLFLYALLPYGLLKLILRKSR